MNKAQLITLFDQDQRKNVIYPGARRQVFPHLIRHVNRLEGGGSWINYTCLDEDNVEETIRQQVAYFKRIGQELEWKVYDYDTPLDLKERLAAHGFQIGEREAILVLDMEEVPQTLLRPVTHDVRRMVDPEDVGDVAIVVEAVWGETFGDLHSYLGNTLRHTPQQLSVYVAYVDDEPASTAWVYFQEGSRFASLWGGSTRPVYRGQGLYTALLAVRVQATRQRNIKYLTVDAGPMSQPILEKFGFQKIAEAYPCKWRLNSEA